MGDGGGGEIGVAGTLLGLNFLTPSPPPPPPPPPPPSVPKGGRGVTAAGREQEGECEGM
jgi:hypothetical protein